MNAASLQVSPGPWRAIQWACHAATTVVADVAGEQVVVAECSGHGRYASESEPDARAIAAVPELLDIVARIEQHLTRAQWRPDGEALESALLRDARAAIAKATGGGRSS